MDTKKENRGKADRERAATLLPAPSLLAFIRDHSCHSWIKKPSEDGAARVFRTFVLLAGTQAITMAFNLLPTKVVAAIAGPRGVGVISLVDQWVCVVTQLCACCLPMAALKFLSAAHSESREAFTRGYVAFLRALLLLSLLGMAAGVLVVLLWPELLGAGLAPYRALIVLALLAIPATNLTLLITNAMAAARAVRAAAGWGMVTAMAVAVLGAGGMLLAGLRGYYLGELIAATGTMIGGLFYLLRAQRLPVHDAQVRVFQEVRRYPEAISLAGGFYVITFAHPLVQLVARYTVAQVGGLEGVGLLQAAMGLGLVIMLLARSSHALVLSPAVNRKEEVSEKLRQVVQFYRALSIGAGLIALPIVLFPDWWLFLLYSKRFVVAAPYVYLFALAEIVQLLAAISQALMTGLDHVSTVVGAALAGQTAIVAVSWWLVPHIGIGGVAFAFACNGLLIVALGAWRLWSSHRIAFHRVMGWLPLSVLIVVAGAGAVSSRMGTTTPALLALKLGLWAAATVAGLRLIRGSHAVRLSAFSLQLRRSDPKADR